jgi:hypothetical protein
MRSGAGLDATMAESPRRFPSPWRADPMPGGYVVRDANGQALAYLYGRETEADAAWTGLSVANAAAAFCPLARI